jgi:hypothetical protein
MKRNMTRAVAVTILMATMVSRASANQEDQRSEDGAPPPHMAFATIAPESEHEEEEDWWEQLPISGGIDAGEERPPETFGLQFTQRLREEYMNTPAYLWLEQHEIVGQPGQHEPTMDMYASTVTETMAALAAKGIPTPPEPGCQVWGSKAPAYT